MITDTMLMSPSTWKAWCSLYLEEHPKDRQLELPFTEKEKLFNEALQELEKDV